MDEPTTAPRVVATPTALDAIAHLATERGPVMFFQSGGCCDGSLPMCFDDGEFVVGAHDVLLGVVGGCSFYIDPRQYEVWKHTQLILDVGDGAPEGFSLPAADDQHFVIRSRVFSTHESAALSQQNR
jgi:uncharacterized protein (DUF779 family)